MKRKLFAVFLSLALVIVSLPSTAFAAALTIWDNPEQSGDGTVYETFDDTAKDALESTQNSYALLGEDVSVDIDKVDDGYGAYGLVFGGNTFDLGGHTISFNYKGEVEGEAETYTGLYVAGDGYNPNVVTNGSIVINDARTPESQKEEVSSTLSAVHSDLTPDITYSDLEITADESLPLTSALDSFSYDANDTSITITNSTIMVGENTPIISLADGSTSVSGTIDSGVFDASLTSKDENLSVNTGTKFDLSGTPGEGDQPGDEPGTGEPSKKGPTVIISKDTAAVVVDAEGNVKLYDSLEEASEAIKNGATVNVVNGLTSEDAPAGFKVEDGKLVEDKKDENQGGGNQGGTTTPTYPIDPGMPGPGEMDDPGEADGPAPIEDDPTVEIEDPDVPLAGLPIMLAPTDKLTRGMLISILHMMDSAPAAEVASFIDVAADSSYAEAIGWAEANGIAQGVGGNKFAPEDFVTRGQLVAFLNRYAAYVGSDVTVALDGDANEVLTWAVAEQIINDFFAALNA